MQLEDLINVYIMQDMNIHVRTRWRTWLPEGRLEVYWWVERNSRAESVNADTVSEPQSAIFSPEGTYNHQGFQMSIQ